MRIATDSRVIRNHTANLEQNISILSSVGGPSGLNVPLDHAASRAFAKPRLPAPTPAQSSAISYTVYTKLAGRYGAQPRWE
jgi:hypothetical protein